MDNSRRRFLKAAGYTALGAGLCAPLGSALARVIKTEPTPGALKGRSWAMIVDTKKCLQKEGCTACLDACHKVHNVPEIDDPHDEIKWIWKEQYEHAFPEQSHDFTNESLKQKKLPVLCNHCERAPCVRVCPTQATWKREDGIVMMDMHRCIGCRYCVVACPYGSRSFNFRDPRPHVADVNEQYPTRMKGVVEKCNFCAERLVKGEIPACVEACQNIGANALIFGDLGSKDPKLMELLRREHTVRRKPGLGTEPQIFYIV